MTILNNLPIKKTENLIKIRDLKKIMYIKSIKFIKKSLQSFSPFKSSHFKMATGLPVWLDFWFS